jgi:hypothetical protein
MTNPKQFVQNLLKKYDLTPLLDELRSFIKDNVTEATRKKFISDILGEIVDVHMSDDDNSTYEHETDTSKINIKRCTNCNAVIDDPPEQVNIDDDDNDDDDCLCVDKDKLSISKWTIIKFVTEVVLIVRCWVWGLCDKPWYILWKKNDKTM